MNYRHHFHVGNFADVFKHLILCLCLEKFHEKSASFFVLETHAGAGRYCLNDDKFQKTGEANDGIKKLLLNPESLKLLPLSFVQILAKINLCKIDELPTNLVFYPGSPLIIKNFLRKTDRAIFAEIQEQVFFELSRNFAGNSKILCSKQDGLQLLKSSLPPPERRGLILIDPSYEKGHNRISKDYNSVLTGLAEAKKRFAHGVYLLWHPIISGEEHFLEAFYQKIHNLGFDKISHFEFEVKLAATAIQNHRKMHRCGMFIFNAPWLISEKISEILPKIAAILAR